MKTQRIDHSIADAAKKRNYKRKIALMKFCWISKNTQRDREYDGDTEKRNRNPKICLIGILFKFGLVICNNWIHIYIYMYKHIHIYVHAFIKKIHWMDYMYIGKLNRIYIYVYSVNFEKFI